MSRSHLRPRGRREASLGKGHGADAVVVDGEDGVDVLHEAGWDEDTRNSQHRAHPDWMEQGKEKTHVSPRSQMLSPRPRSLPRSRRCKRAGEEAEVEVHKGVWVHVRFMSGHGVCAEVREEARRWLMEVRAARGGGGSHRGRGLP